MGFLLTKLTGKARQVFNEMRAKDALDYRKLKETVLKCFKITPEFYRLKFINLRMSDNAAYVECTYKLLGFVKKWNTGAGAYGDFDKLLITLEKLLNMAPEEIRVAVCDTKPDSALQAEIIADEYIENRVHDGHKLQEG